MIEDVLLNRYEKCLKELDIYENNSSLILSKIIINDECRNQGIGTKVINDLIDYADSKTQIVVLTPSKDFGSSVNRLTQFYKRFGFKMNKGVNKNFEFKDTMIRYPIKNGKKRLTEQNNILKKIKNKLLNNSKEILNTIKVESVESYVLIQKHLNGEKLNEIEKKKLYSNLKDILTKLGYGAIFMLPGGSVLLLLLNIFNNNFKKKEKMVNEIRVINPDNSLIVNEKPLRDSDIIRVYHGFNNYEDAIMAVKFGFSGKEKAKRVYSYESNNNPYGLFVTLDFETAKKFTHPRSKKGISVILELSVKVSDLEAPVWPGGSYTVQGQMAQFWKDEKDRYKQGTLKAREEAKNSDIDFITNSDRPEVAATLMGSEKQALFIGDINPNMIKSVFYGESGKHGINPSRFERMAPKKFLNKFESHEPERNYDNTISNKGMEYNRKKNKFFNPNDEFSMDKLDKIIKDKNYGYDSAEELVGILIKHNELENYFYPKQIKQINSMELINENKLRGGKADKISKKDIANKFGVTLAKINKELDMGVEIELEHTKSRRLAKEIAMDHLVEIPDYYTRLKKMEKEGERKWKKREKKLDESIKHYIRDLVKLNLNG